MSTVALGDGNAVETSFTDLSKCNNDTGHPQVENGGRGGTRRGFYVTHVVAAVYVMITICLVVAVALIVHFAHPCRKSCKCTGAPPGGEQGDQTTTDPEDDEAMWLRCLELSRERDQCFPDLIPCSTSAPVTTEPPAAVLQSIRLPSSWNPYHYNLDIRPDLYHDDPEDFTFNGTVVIYMEAVETTDVIIVNQRKLDISRDLVVVTREDGTDIPVDETLTDPDRQLFNISLSSAVTAGTHVTLTIGFSAPLTDDLWGLYWSEYKENGEKKYMATTQFGLTEARNAFPCFDEPAYKATFNITIERKSELHTALSNAPLLSTGENVNGWVADHFDTTPVMSTYILALSVSNYSSVSTYTSGGLTAKNLSYYARPEAAEDGQLEYAASVGADLINHYEEYFNQSYPMDKFDQITVAGFAFSAMENWGLVVYKEFRMLYDPLYSTTLDKQRIASVQAHEIVHQWMGNLVTNDWWGDAWLHEGMATYYQNDLYDVVENTWDREQLYMSQNFYSALEADSTGSSHPIHNNYVLEPSEILNHFSRITYDKASAIIRMVQHLVFKNDNSFHDAIRTYVDRFAYRNANYTDLLSVWDEYKPADLSVTVTEVSLTWLQQMGYPILNVNRLSDTQIKVTQKMYLNNPDTEIVDVYPTPHNHVWKVPFQYQNDAMPNASTEVRWLLSEEETFAISSDSWILLNPEQYGFYRVNYDLSNWNSLIAAINTSHTVIGVVSRAEIIDDSFHFARSRDLAQVVSLQATEYLHKETDYLPWYAANNGFFFIKKMLARMAQYGQLLSYLRALVDTNYQSLGWNQIETDPIQTSYLRTVTLTVACEAEHKDCVTNADQKFTEWMNNKDDLSIIPPDFRHAVYCTAIATGGEDRWDFLFEQYQKEWHGPSSIDRPKIRDALACSRQPWILQRYISRATDKSSSYRYVDDDKTAILRAVAANPIGTNIVWDYVDANWDLSLFSILYQVATLCNTEHDLNKMESFFTRHPATTDMERVYYDDIRTTVKLNIRWMDDNINDISQWLNTVAP